MSLFPALRSRLTPLVLLLGGVAAGQPAGPSPEGAAPFDPSLAADVVELDNPAFPTAPGVLAPRRTPLADLLPVVPRGPLREAGAALEAGQPATALKLLSALPDAPDVRYLRTMAGLEQAPTAELARTLEELGGALPALADRCALQAGLADEELGNLVAARRLLASVPPDSRVFPEARFGLARILRRAGELAAAADALTPLAAGAAPTSGRDVAAEALLLRAELARTVKDPATERQELLTLWTRHPRSPLSSEAERRLGGRIPAEARVTRAEVLVDLHRNRDALRLLDPMRLSPPDPLGCRAQLARGRALRKERRHTEVEQVLAPVAARCSPEIRVRALYVLGASQAVVRPEAAVATYEALADGFPAHPYADDALYLAAELRAAGGDVIGALQRLEEVATRYPDGDFAGEALFKIFWLHHRMDDAAAGLAALARIEERFASADDPYDLERARYWRGRVLEALGERTGALTLWQALARDHPATYYGLLARSRVAERDPAAAEALVPGAAAGLDGAVPAVADPAGLRQDRHYQAGAQLLTLGLGEAATQELLAVRRSDQTRDALRVLVGAIARAGDARAAHGVARTDLRWALNGQVTAEMRDVWDAAYPRAYRELVERYSKAPRVDPDLLQALMREESALDPRALSWAGALGLTQLMLPTAQEVAQTLRLGRPSPEGLLEPALNIQLGAAYLGRLLARFGGNPVYALASYNAGASAVERWRTSRSGLDLDAFVEEIPLSETRGYVKRVLRSYNTYRLLDGRPLVSAGLGPAAAKTAEARLGPGAVR